MSNFRSIFNALETRVHSDPDKIVYMYANEEGDIEHQLTWRTFAAKVDTLCGYLRSVKQLQVGDRVLLVYPPSIDFVVAFAACMRAGLVPVPVYPPNPRKSANATNSQRNSNSAKSSSSGRDAFERIANDCGARLILTNDAYEQSRRSAGPQVLVVKDSKNSAHVLEWVSTSAVVVGQYLPVYGPSVSPDQIALIQYTSGSTSAPKGVVITYGNLSHHTQFIGARMHLDDDSRAVFWVPQYHDLGLIAGIMMAMAGLVQLTLFSPFAFIKRPALWFELMHRLKATHTVGPNFAFDLALQKTTLEQRAQWDLSSLRLVMSAAEPVRADTVRRFINGFAVSGLRPDVFLPCYGLAEHTVGVTLNGGTLLSVDREQLEKSNIAYVANETTSSTLELVSCGKWPEDIDLRVVNPETREECPLGSVGEVWVDSPSKAAGYWQLDAINQETFFATLVNDYVNENNTNRGYLRTGDFGFIHQGELYICGRMKDLLIIAGRNVYPQDIEDTVELIDSPVKVVSCAAFTIDVQTADGQGELTTEEKLVLLVDIRQLRLERSALENLAQQLQKAILEAHQLACHSIVIAPIGTVLKTTSGKVRRQACRQQWLDGALSSKALYLLEAKNTSCTDGARDLNRSSVKATADNSIEASRWSDNASRETILRVLASEFLNLPSVNAVDLEVPLIDQGMSSLVAVDFCQAYELATGEELSISQFFNYPSINGLNAELESVSRAKSTVDIAAARVRDIFGNQCAKGLEVVTLDNAFALQVDPVLVELHALRHYLRNNRYSKTGFRIGSWAIRPAQVSDVAAIHRLDQQEYGWLGEDATDDIEFIQHQIVTLNGQVEQDIESARNDMSLVDVQKQTPWFWVLEKRRHLAEAGKVVADIVGWYVMQPTAKKAENIKSWADATDGGKLTGSFDPNGKNLYLVAAGISREFTKQAHRLMVLNALSLMAVHQMDTASACLAMPGYSAANALQAIAPEDYVQLKLSNGTPRDPFLAFFQELWPADHRELRLLRNGYPPDQLSAGHGVCACVDVRDHRIAIDRLFDVLTQQRQALFETSDVNSASSTPMQALEAV